MAKKLKEVREEHSITQGMLANATGLHQAVLSNLENNQIEPPVDDLIHIEKAIGAKVDWEDKHGMADKMQVLNAMFRLIQNYPLKSVINFVHREINDRKEPRPIDKIATYSEQIPSDDSDPMLPLDAQMKRTK
jgi:transcriptional regulator with XRE-family HTH domain